MKIGIPVRILSSVVENGQNYTPRSTQSQISTTTLSLTTIRPAAVRVLLKMMLARCAHLFRSDNGAARRLELPTSFRMPRHWDKGEAQRREEIVSTFNPVTGS